MNEEAKKVYDEQYGKEKTPLHYWKSYGTFYTVTKTTDGDLEFARVFCVGNNTYHISVDKTIDKP